MAAPPAHAARRKKRRRKKKKKHHPQPAAVAAPGAVTTPPTPRLLPHKYRWIVAWDDSRGDGLVRPVDDGADHDTPQDPATIPVRPLPSPQNPPAPKPPPGVGVYPGPFGRVQANRLLNRAGFGPRPGQAEQLAAMGLQSAVHSLTRPERPGDPHRARRHVDDDGNPLAPADAWGHDHLWWLDRMVRTDQPLVERMALVLHDWFATSNDERLQAAADDRPVEPLPQRLLRLLPRPASRR